MVQFALTLATLSMFAFTLIPLLPSHWNFYVLLVMVILGLALNAPEALLMDLAVENTYPAPAEVVCQFLIVVGNLVGIGLILLISVVQSFSTTAASFLSVLVLLLPTYAWRSYEGQYKRYDSEVAQQRLGELAVGFTPAGLVALDHGQGSGQNKLGGYQADSEVNRLL